jgi:NAD(P)-dependent dehydrogenase (short-subunit alcohol dehydrogenase family)
MRLKDKTAIVTGAAGGIGRAIAMRFASEGSNVILADLLIDEAENVLTEIKRIGGRGNVIAADITRSAAVEELINKTLCDFEAIDILVNCAAVGIRAPFLEVSEEIWDKTIAVNLKGTFLCTQKVASTMVARGISGAIVNLSSICGTVADKFSRHAPYEASKGGVNLLTKVAALELAEFRIRVNAIAPGRIKTPLLNKDPEHIRRVCTHIPLGEYGEPDDVASAAVFLVSDEAKYITGTVLYVDGGWTIQ